MTKRVNEELFRAGLAMGLTMGGHDQGLLNRIDAFKKEVEELGVEVNVAVTVGRVGAKGEDESAGRRKRGSS